MEIKIAGKYTIERKLGEGAFGRVYLGKDSETGEVVAMKLVRWSVMGIGGNTDKGESFAVRGKGDAGAFKRWYGKGKGRYQRSSQGVLARG